MDKKYYEVLSKVDTSKMTEKKNGLTYLTWSKAFNELLSRFPEATYKIQKFEGKPYYIDEAGAMVYTSMTIEGVTREMWLPVLDGANKPMKEKAYTVKTKYKEFVVNAVNMFDVNKAIMRCLVKNMAVFGLGLNIYAGEDLPFTEDEVVEVKVSNNKVNPEHITQSMYEKYSSVQQEKIRKWFAKKNGLESLTKDEFYDLKKWSNEDL